MEELLKRAEQLADELSQGFPKKPILEQARICLASARTLRQLVLEIKTMKEKNE